MLKIDSIKVADSIKRIRLLKEIEALKGAAVHQRNALKKQLRELERDDSLHQIRLLEELAELKRDSVAMPVSPFVDTLFFIHSRIGAFTAAERAVSIESKIKRLYHDLTFLPDSMKLIVNENSTDISYQDLIVMNVNEIEALWNGMSHQELANQYRSEIIAAIRNHRDLNSTRNTLLRIGSVILVLIAILAIILLINFGFRKIRLRLLSRERMLNEGALPDSKRVISRQKIRGILFFLPVIRWVFIITGIYLMLPLIFREFPVTVGVANVMLSWFTNPLRDFYDEFLEYLPKLFTILLIVFIAYNLVRLLRYFANEIGSGVIAIPGFYPEWARPTFMLVKLLIYAFGFIIIFPYLPGSESPIFRGVSVFLGLLFSIGSSSAISNAVAGYLITYMRPFKIGDRIKIGDISGYIVDKSMLVTRVRSIKNEDITIPNSTILTGYTTNYSRAAAEHGLIINSSVTIGYDAPWQKVHALLIEAALSTKGVINEAGKAPFVLQTSLNDFHVTYQINAYTNLSAELENIYSELHQHIQNKFNEAGVEILSPHYRSLRDGNNTTIHKE
jgi:small-conductance mechanosensitive channel